LIIGTVKDNLRFAKKDATDEEIKNALKKASADFVYQMEDKLDTYIGSTAI